MKNSPLLESIQLVSNPPNARRTMEALREMGYDSYASVLDIIDNAIDAQATVIKVDIVERQGDILIDIEDNGCGMDVGTLAEALRLGSETDRETGDLGKFGMGLVTASIGLSKCVQVLTRETDTLFFGAFDLDEIASRNEFIKRVGLAPASLENRLASATGTVISLSKTDRISNRHPTTFANTLRNRIGQVFRKFLKAGIRIEVNGTTAEPIDPLMLAHPDTRVLLEMELPVESTGSATLRVVELPDLGQALNKELGIIPQNSGFYVVRNNREIIEAETFDFYKKHPDYSHFRAELAFDGSMDQVFHTDIKKTSIHPSQSFLDKLRQTTQGLITEAGRQGRKRANAGKGQINHSSAEANIRRRLSLIPKPQALVEQRSPKTKKESHGRGNGENKRNPHVTHLRTVTGLNVVFDEGDYGEQNPFYLVKQQGRQITVSYNREHPFWRELVEHKDDARVVAILDYLVFALANAELLVPEQATIVKTNVNSTLVGLLV
jgi:hypothetical protein